MKSPALHFALTAAVAVTAGCASHARPSIENDPAAIAAVRADLRIVRGETTWVTRGSGYELVGRSKSDLTTLPSQLDREAAMLRRVFPHDSLAPLVVTVRRAAVEGKPFIPAAPIPTTITGHVVEVVLSDPTAKKPDDKARSEAVAALGIGLLAERTPTLPVVRAWLSAHASTLSGKPARLAEASGEFEDPRIPGWAQEMVPSLTADSLVDRFTKALAVHPDNLIPLSVYFSMERASFGDPSIAQRGRGGERGGGAAGGGGGGTSPGGRTGGRGGAGGGGMGGRGGMGGGGRGGRGGGGGGSAARSQPELELRGSVLFDAQSVVLGQYLGARDGYDVIGELIDAHILDQPIEPVLAKRNALTLAQMDLDWLQWLLDRSAILNR